MNSKRIFLLIGAAVAVWYFFLRDKIGGGGKSTSPTAYPLTSRPNTGGNNVNPVTNSNATNPYLQRTAANNALNKNSGSGNGYDAIVNPLVRGGVGLLNNWLGGAKSTTSSGGSLEPWKDRTINPPDVGPDQGPPSSAYLPTYGPVYTPPEESRSVYQFGSLSAPDDSLETDAFGSLDY
jgi:hypothetical protein